MADELTSVAVDVAKAMQKGLLSGDGDPQLAEIAAHFIHLTGGPRGMAQLLYKEFKDTKSDMMRHRILESILRAMKFANEQAGPKSDLGLASDEDLKRELFGILQKAQESRSAPKTS